MDGGGSVCRSAEHCAACRDGKIAPASPKKAPRENTRRLGSVWAGWPRSLIFLEQAHDYDKVAAFRYGDVVRHRAELGVARWRGGRRR